mgnify:CR=1 FL=1
MSVCYNLHVETVATVSITSEVSVARDVIGSPKNARHASLFVDDHDSSHTICQELAVIT